MLQEAEKRSEFRFPVVIPVEYFKPNNSAISSYSLDLNSGGAFISSDEPFERGSLFKVHFTIPFDPESSKIFRTEGAVIWNKVHPFRSRRNGMGIRFAEKLSKDMLLSALADNERKLATEIQAKRILEERVKAMESKLENAGRLAALGQCAEKILLKIANPILALSGRLESVKTSMNNQIRTLEADGSADSHPWKGMVDEFDEHCNEIDRILNDYRVISNLAHIAGDNGDTFEKKLSEYDC